MITLEGLGTIPECKGMTMLECHDLAAELCRQGVKQACDLAGETFTAIMIGEEGKISKKKTPTSDRIINIPLWVIGATLGLGIGLYILWGK